jgi:hypothetical protein
MTTRFQSHLPVNWIRFTCTDPPTTVLVRLSDERPNIDSGYGGWNPVVRPRRRPYTTWAGMPVFHMTIPVLFDGFIAGRSVERDIARLENLAFPVGSNTMPPTVRIAATGGAIPHQEKTYVIDALTWGDAIMDTHGNRTRQQVTVGLMEYIHETLLQELSAAARERVKASAYKPKAGAANKRIIAALVEQAATSTPPAAVVEAAAASTSSASTSFGQGEDLLTIAARELGDASRWTEIAELNGIRDPRSIAPGQVLRLP